jgi:hypothetical protein
MIIANSNCAHRCNTKIDGGDDGQILDKSGIKEGTHELMEEYKIHSPFYGQTVLIPVNLEKG